MASITLERCVSMDVDLLDSPITCRELPFAGIELDVNRSRVVDRAWQMWTSEQKTIIGSPGLSSLNDRAYYTLLGTRA